jgi:hypothetical protein
MSGEIKLQQNSGVKPALYLGNKLSLYTLLSLKSAVIVHSKLNNHNSSERGNYFHPYLDTHQRV